MSNAQDIVIGTRKAIVIRHSEKMTQSETGDHFRPRYAVDVEVLDADGERTGEIYQQLPVPANWVWGLPEPGTLVRIGYDYNRVDHPYISEILTEMLEIPAEVNDEIIIYANDESKISLNRRTGKISIFSYGEVAVDADKITLTGSLKKELIEEESIVEMNSTEEISGTKKVEAMGNVKIGAGESVRVNSAGNTSVVSLSSLELFGGMGAQLVGGPASITLDPIGTMEIKNAVVNLKLVLDTILDELAGTVVTIGKGPNSATLIALKAQLALLLR